jgi:amidase
MGEDMTQLPFRSATELAAAVRAGEVSSTELVECYLSRIEALNPGLGAVVTLDAERARREAADADRRLAQGAEPGPLHGLPVTVKDCLETAGMRTTCGAPELAGYVPARDAEAVGRLRRAGAIVIGKTNLPIWASDCQSYNDLFGTTNNPWDTARTPGGSSGGAAAAVAAGLCALELGSDLGGSLRIPAHWCGVYALKPSFGVVPVQGHIPPPPGMHADMDIGVLGPVARSAADLELCLAVLAGPDPLDSAAWRLELPAAPARTVSQWRVAVWPEEPGWPVDRAVAERLAAVADSLAAAGMTVNQARPVDLEESLDVAQRLIQGGIAGFLPDPDYMALAGRAAGFDPQDQSPPARFARNITQSARDLARAKQRQHALRASWARFFTEYDILLCPAMRTTAIAHDHNPDVDARVITVNGEPVPYADQFAWVQAVGVAYLPAVVAPAGIAADGLPAGIQIVGPYLHDRTVTAFARALADLTGGFTPPPAYAATTA